MVAPTASQVASTRAVVGWYLRGHFGTPSDPGVLDMFCDRTRVGAFAVDRAALRSGDPGALFRVLVATTMFQRRQDVQILRILRGISPEDAAELGNAHELLRLVDEARCEHMRSTVALTSQCDLSKDPTTRAGCCTANPL